MSSPVVGPPDVTSIPQDDAAMPAPQLDIQSLPTSLPGQATPMPAPQPTAPRPSLWRQVLSGALQGLAAGAQVNTRGMSTAGAFVAGAGAGVNQVLNVQPQQQAALDVSKAQVALHYANLQHIQREMNLMPDDKREQYLNDAIQHSDEMLKAGAITPLTQPGDLVAAQQQLQQLHAKNPWAVYSIMPSRDADGNVAYSAVQFSKAPLQSDLKLEGAGDDGQDITIPSGTPADQVGKYYTNYLSKKLAAESASNLESQKQKGRIDLQNVKGSQAVQIQNSRNAAAQQRAAITATGTNVVAYDPQYQNADGSKGANVVLDKGTAQQRGLFSYKADPSAINANIAGMNDVQTKINQLADVAMDSRRMSQLQPELAAAILEHGKGIKLGISGTELDTSRINEGLYKEDVSKANQATRDFVTAYIGAHEAITQLPRLQTFGKSSRMTETQLHAALNMLPQAGDDAGLAQQKMLSLQNTIDPLRKQFPHMPGAELIPSWHEQQAKPPAATHVYDPTTALLRQIGGQQ